jgi:hypothetical protein
MKSEHLGIGDRTFLINRLIQQAPINTLVREFFKKITVTGGKLRKLR